MRLGDVTAYLDDYLRVREVPDAPQALNGLQLANGGEITRVAAAVDLCEATVRLAAGARALIGQAAAAGLDTYITGEGAHHTYLDAEELGLNVFYAGHYATETVGVKALTELLHQRFALPWVFLDHPTGL